MRLTLRTLLAYMDDFLEPEDRDDIAQKLGSNEQAAALVQRIRDVTGRMRLGAPQVIGNGMGRDANSVAEYLESTLAPEQVLLIERVCLESDVHLAEVGAAHHIVTMILSEPAQIDPASRQRMYGLIDQAPTHDTGEAAAPASPAPSAAAVAVAATTPVAAMAASGAATAAAHDTPAAEVNGAARRKPEVPEYLRASSGLGWKPIVLTLLGAALATALVLGIMFPDRVLVPLGLRKPSTETSHGSQAHKTPDDKKTQDGMQPPGDNTPLSTPADVPAVKEGPIKKPESPKTPVVPPVETAPDATPKTPAVDATPKQPDGKQPADPAATPAVLDAPPATPAVPPITVAPDKSPEGPKVVAVPVPVSPPAVPVTDPAAKQPDVKQPDVKQPDVKQPDVKQSDEVARLEPKPSDPKPDAAKPPVETAAPVAIGRLLSQDQVLLRAKQQGDGWERLPSSAPVYVGDRLLILPAFRPLINVGGVSLQLEGPAEVQLAAAGADGLPHVTVAYGRMVVRALGQPNSRLHINTGAGEGTLTLQNAEAAIGLQVQLIHPPGTDPEKVPSARQVDLYASSGKVDWTAGGAPIVLAAPQHLILTNGAAQPSPGRMPAWIASSQASALDARAAQRIHEGMPANRSIQLSLSELLLQPRIEVRGLAARCSAYVGLFDPLVVGLGDEDQRAGWATLVSELQAAVARDPQTAAAVREAFVQRRREKAPDLYRMLWGYSAAGLKNGDARRLVDTLDHEDMDFRVLSFMNLQEITGMGLFYRPEWNASKRKPSIIRWQKRLDEGKVTYANGAAAAPAAPKIVPAPPLAPAPAPPAEPDTP